LFCSCMGLLVGHWSWVKMLKNPHFETNALFLTFVKKFLSRCFRWAFLSLVNRFGVHTQSILRYVSGVFVFWGFSCWVDPLTLVTWWELLNFIFVLITYFDHF
jgi:hypothetical protein